MPRHNSIAQSGLAFLFVRQIRNASSAAAAIPTIAGTFSVPGPAFAFVRAAELDAIDRQTRAEIKKAGAFRSVKFVRAEAGGIDRRPDLVGSFPNDCTMSLCKKHAALSAARRDFRHRLNDAGFVVRRHDGNQRGVGPDRALELVRIDQAFGRNIEPGHLKTFPLFQMLERVQHRVMLGAVADQMLSVRRADDGRARGARDCSPPSRRW